MNNKSVLIVDYGVGNIFNVKRAFESVGASAEISRDITKIKDASRIVLPGVGAFAAGMAGLREHSLIEPLMEAAQIRKVPFFGVCLGMQLLMDHSEENGEWAGLGLVKGKVKKFIAPTSTEVTYKIPHMGWNTVTSYGETPWANTIFSGIPEEEYFYFVHSYYVSPTIKSDTLALTEYTGHAFCSAIRHENLSGCQFHPERSGKMGLKILRNFLYE